MYFSEYFEFGLSPEKTQIEGMWEEGADENIWTQEGGSGRRVENTA